MSRPIVEAEVALSRCVEAMRDALLTTVKDALPQSTGSPDTTSAECDLVDTAAQRLEWESGVEQQRIGRIVDELDRHFAELERALTALPDVPIALLDRDIAWLNTEASSLAQAMISTYDEAESLAAKLEGEIVTQSVPSI
ncbi:uncharacterized protein TM35_000054030 [Trypanosoma theileri]|uniref:Uncharacterized protein n=1 Tax=Trypanosoma theileri TaxID=67003 RepID=A0A1X0P4E5_9TRYP|nr:uncharacterized protein TM35_000054030 [Trypanosoma theileri]ORC91807.1 hypothetical protein TM35_000054030 [Trypanosoma theileri]